MPLWEAYPIAVVSGVMTALVVRAVITPVLDWWGY